MEPNAERKSSPVDEYVELDKSTLLKIVNNCEYEAVQRTRKGQLALSEKEIRKAGKMLRRGIHLMDSKSLCAIIFQLNKELETVMHLAMLNRNKVGGGEISKEHAAMMYDMTIAGMHKL